MELDPAAWVVHRHLVDPRLDELDARTSADVPTSATARSVPIDLPATCRASTPEALEDWPARRGTLLGATDEVTSAG